MLELNFNKLVVVHKELFKDELVSLKASSISGVVFETHAAGMNSTFLINKLKNGNYAASIVFGNLYKGQVCPFNMIVGSIEVIIKSINVWQINRLKMITAHTD